MRQFVFASLVATAVFAAPAAHAGVGRADPVHNASYTSPANAALVDAALQRPADSNGLTGSDASFAAEDSDAIDVGNSAMSDSKVVSPVRRTSLSRRAKTAAAILPEPATWAMLLMGFGAVGAVLRRKLRQSEARFNDRIRRIEAGETS